MPLNYLCDHDISEDDCNRCSIHGITYRCPEGCPDFKDVRKEMPPEVSKERNRLMEKFDIKDDPRYGRRK